MWSQEKNNDFEKTKQEIVQAVSDGVCKYEKGWLTALVSDSSQVRIRFVRARSTVNVLESQWVVNWPSLVLALPSLAMIGQGPHNIKVLDLSVVEFNSVGKTHLAWEGGDFTVSNCTCEIGIR